MKYIVIDLLKSKIHSYTLSFLLTVLNLKQTIIQDQNQKIKYTEKYKRGNSITTKQQDILWNLSHHKTKNHPGILKICHRMPIMIKYNEATECRVTNGAEGIAVGWKQKQILSDKQTLLIIFIKKDILFS